MIRASKSRRATPAPSDAIDLSDDLNLFDYVVELAPRKLRVKADKRRFNPIVTDDWPEIVPITKQELDIFELYFADFFDRMLAEPCKP